MMTSLIQSNILDHQWLDRLDLHPILVQSNKLDRSKVGWSNRLSGRFGSMQINQLLIWPKSCRFPCQWPHLLYCKGITFLIQYPILLWKYWLKIIKNTMSRYFYFQIWNIWKISFIIIIIIIKLINFIY